MQWPDLGGLVLLTPDLGRVAGTLDIGLKIGGTLASPRVEGRAAWTDGQVGVPAWGLVVEGIEANATTADGSTLQYQATGHAGTACSTSKARRSSIPTSAGPRV